jgi:serine/threonine protein kinase
MAIMITFSCARCGVKLQVDKTNAGRQAKCPTCKSLVSVPKLAMPMPMPPSVEGQSSSLDKLGLVGKVSLPQKKPRSNPSRPVIDANVVNQQAGQRLVITGEIARGGMGAVLRAADRDIRREIAVKYMLEGHDPKKKVRFIEEAQITGQLEHPNIVPIHELGADAQGRLFFTMKLVHGRSLRETLDELRANSRATTPTLTWFLNVFVNVCNALAYAHSRGVIHRDLKPGNVMVGDFGEVYVMDWGLAKVIPVDGGSTTVAIQSSGQNSKLVATNRGDVDEHTVEGEILGTPVYMSPEQAAGRIHDIDARSDVYALGAILYEILTLRPPHENQGGYLPTVMKVIEGGIEPPQVRAPDRARKGKIPPELAAIAMKALQNNRADRYPNVEALRHDIELFREGRAVSVKGDSRWEAVRKLAWRHPGTALASAVASILLLVMLIVSVRINYRARVEAQQALADKNEQAKASVPSFVLAAELFARQKDVESALKQVDTALGFEPNDPKAHRLKGVLLIASHEFARAHQELTSYLKNRPDDLEAAALAKLCGEEHPETNQLVIADHLSRQGMPELADLLALKAQERLELYRRRIRDAYGFTLDERSLKIDATGKITLSLWYQTSVKDLMALRGMAITTLILNGTPIESLTPLAGMPLEALHMGECGNVKDLGPLRGMKLTTLDISGCRARDLSVIRELPVETLYINQCGLRDISFLRNMPLKSLSMTANPVQDLSPLAGKNLTRLHAVGFPIKDTSALRSMPLVDLDISNSGVNDLSFLSGKRMHRLVLTNCPVSNLTPLKGMQLSELYLANCKQLTSLAPIHGQPVHTLDLRGSGVEDLSDLEGMPLRMLVFNPASIKKGINVVRSCKTLTLIDSAWPPRMGSAEFWKQYDETMRKMSAPPTADGRKPNAAKTGQP